MFKKGNSNNDCIPWCAVGPTTEREACVLHSVLHQRSLSKCPSEGGGDRQYKQVTLTVNTSPSKFVYTLAATETSRGERNIGVGHFFQRPFS